MNDEIFSTATRFMLAIIGGLIGGALAQLVLHAWKP
jgi:hypothetical protein